jgi:hypothetical protein
VESSQVLSVKLDEIITGYQFKCVIIHSVCHNCGNVLLRLASIQVFSCWDSAFYPVWRWHGWGTSKVGGIFSSEADEKAQP